MPHSASVGLISSSPLWRKWPPFSQTIFSDAFSWMKSFVFWLKLHRSLFLMVQWPSIALDNVLALNRRQTIICTNAHPIYWRIYAALGGGGLREYRYQHVQNINRWHIMQRYKPVLFKVAQTLLSAMPVKPQPKTPFSLLYTCTTL